MKTEEELRDEVAQRQRAFDRALEELRQLGQERSSLGYYLKTYPWVFVAGGFALGLMVGVAGSGRRARSRGWLGR